MTLEQVRKLTDDGLRIRVAKLLGKKDIYWIDGIAPVYGYVDSETYTGSVPDYPHDLNACHEMELTRIYCPGGDREKRIIDYTGFLDVLTLEDVFPSQSATARQRCEAFVMTMEEK